jgi:hypothetical protein
MFKSEREAAAWLSGIIDGEGSVSMRPVRGSRSFVREIRVTNTDEKLLAGVTAALDLLGVAWIRYDRSERERLGTKPIFDIVVSRKANLERLAATLTLRSAKADQLDHMLGSWIRPGVPPEGELRAMVATEGDAAIARRFGVTPGAVWSWRRKYGIVR